MVRIQIHFITLTFYCVWNITIIQSTYKASGYSSYIVDFIEIINVNSCSGNSRTRMLFDVPKEVSEKLFGKLTKTKQYSCTLGATIVSRMWYFINVFSRPGAVIVTQHISRSLGLHTKPQNKKSHCDLRATLSVCHQWHYYAVETIPKSRCRKKNTLYNYPCTYRCKYSRINSRLTSPRRWIAIVFACTGAAVIVFYIL